MTFQSGLSHHSLGTLFTPSDLSVSALPACSALAQSHASTLTCADTFVSLIQPQKANADTDLSVDISDRIKKKKEENHSTWLRTGVIRVGAASVCTGFDCVMKGWRDRGSIGETAIQDDRQQPRRLVFPEEEKQHRGFLVLICSHRKIGVADSLRLFISCKLCSFFLQSASFLTG